MSDTSDPRARPVPTGRANRAARMGGLTAGLLGSAAAEGARQVFQGRRPSPRDLFLTPANAHRLTRKLSEMRGAAMKMGQLLSLEAGDLLTPELAAALKPLQAQARFMPPGQLKRVLSDAWGADFLKQFKRFDVRPIAAASIGQVHRAQTKDGRDLAIKVQYPGIRNSIDSDIRNLGTLMRIPGVLPKGLDLAPLLEAARQQLHDEADYNREAHQQMQFHADLYDDPQFIVPKIHNDLCTPDILTMDFIPSEPIDTVADTPQTTRDTITTALFDLLLREVFEFQRVQSDPNFANFRWQPETGRIVLLDFGATVLVRDDVLPTARSLLRAALDQDRDAIATHLTTLGLMPENMPDDLRAKIMEMVDLASGPLMDVAGFNYGDTRLVRDLREKGMALGQDRRFTQIPPADMLLLNRKAAGLFLLATKLNARVSLHALYQKYV